VGAGNADRSRGLAGAQVQEVVAVEGNEKVPHRRASISTFTGREFFPLEPHAEDVDPIDVAHALSLKCRYTGHCTVFYSVAEHCALMSDYLERQGLGPVAAFYGLIHDAGEAYLPDVASPIKALIPGFKDSETRVLAAICERFGLEFPFPREVDALVGALDVEFFLLERETIMKRAPWWRGRGPDRGLAESVRVEGWSPERAELEWIRRYVSLAR
jgi:hypothetical protein